MSPNLHRPAYHDSPRVPLRRVSVLHLKRHRARRPSAQPARGNRQRQRPRALGPRPLVARKHVRRTRRHRKRPVHGLRPRQTRDGDGRARGNVDRSRNVHRDRVARRHQRAALAHPAVLKLPSNQQQRPRSPGDPHQVSRSCNQCETFHQRIMIPSGWNISRHTHRRCRQLLGVSILHLKRQNVPLGRDQPARGNRQRQRPRALGPRPLVARKHVRRTRRHRKRPVHGLRPRQTRDLDCGSARQQMIDRDRDCDRVARRYKGDRLANAACYIERDLHKLQR